MQRSRNKIGTQLTFQNSCISGNEPLVVLKEGNLAVHDGIQRLPQVIIAFVLVLVVIVCFIQDKHISGYI
jgi:hypothetical protein